ncbi:Sulfate transporter 1.1 [Thalictrum thalictroides]|uniref:Sulfate transporter 1.1 n=1 Tax=Thalictrum thalictroides TaxID=46969 RepID=A0A7J6W5L2_THATH|nr:Sulfate transporter 1.1 [Thalictrum thalictroides]
MILGLEYFFPIFLWAPHYSFKLFRSDVVSGLTIASLAIPQGISYAKLANLPPIIGLYSSFVPPLLYALLGSSRHLAVGPVSIASLVMGSMLEESVSPTENPEIYLSLAFTATFFAGLFQASLGILRLGFIIDFLSKATLIGFTAGAAIIVSLQQLKGLLGIVHFTTKMQFVSVMSSVFHETNEWSWHTIIMGLSFLVFLLTARQMSMRRPKLFWISAAAPLTSVLISTLIIFIFKAQIKGISTIGHLPRGVNPPSANMLYFHAPYLSLALKTGIITGILSLTEGIAVGRTFASLKNYQVDGNKEMVAIGVMNMAGSCTSCYVTTGSFSRSAVNNSAGAQSAVSNIVMAATVLVTLLFLMPLFYYTPNVILGAIIVTAVIGLIDYQAALKLWRVDKLDFVACLCAFFGVLFISVQIGLVIAVGVSVFKILLNVTRPNTVILGNIPGTHIYQNLRRYGEASRIPYFLILGIESPIYFANSTYLQERLLRWVREEEEWIQTNKESPLKCVILDLTTVSSIDTSGLETIAELRRTLEKRSLQLVLVNPVGGVMEKLCRSKVLESFGPSGLYLTVGEAIADLSATYKAQLYMP